MDVDFDFPELEEKTVVRTGMMNMAINRLLKAHPKGGFAVWCGRAGIGKSTTAEEFVRIAGEKYNPSDPRAFKAVQYEVGRSGESSKNDMKRGIRSLYVGVGYRIDNSLYRQSLAEELAVDLVQYLKKMNIGMIFVDEAGTLPLDAIRGMVLVSDTAKQKNWTLTIVMIGMDDLPHKLIKLPQVDRRVIEWCYFQPCTLEETHKLLSALHSFFAQLDISNKADKKLIEFIHEKYMGLPGGMVPFIIHFSDLYDQFPDEDAATLVEAAYFNPFFSKQKVMADYQGDYKGSVAKIMKIGATQQAVDDDDSEDA